MTQVQQTVLGVVSGLLPWKGSQETMESWKENEKS